MTTEDKLNTLVSALMAIAIGSTDQLTRNYCVIMLVEAGEKEAAKSVAAEALSYNSQEET